MPNRSRSHTPAPGCCRTSVRYYNFFSSLFWFAGVSRLAHATHACRSSVARLPLTRHRERAPTHRHVLYKQQRRQTRAQRKTRVRRFLRSKDRTFDRRQRQPDQMFTAVSQSLTAFIAAAIFAGYLVTVTEQHPPKWFKPHSWDSPVKYSHLQYKPQLVHLVQPPLPKPKPLSYLPHSISLNKPFKTDLSCQLRKVVFTQDADSPQYVVYKSKIPDLKEFTLCHWHNVFNYTHDQPIFSYTHSGKSRVIYSWIENTPDKTYYSLAINGHTMYRINYPEKLFKWYHVCQSWNGHTGEWQLWINTERVARGFYNLMVGKMIKGGGVAISGREYLEQALAVHHPSYSGELTLVTLYKAALTAGKAYNDHKHHHVHNFHHGYDESVDEADTAEPPAEPAGPDPTPHPHLAHGGPFVNGQLVPKLPVPTPIVTAAPAADADEDFDLSSAIGQQPPSSPSFGDEHRHRRPYAENDADDDDAADENRPPYVNEHQLFDGGLYDFYAPVRGGHNGHHHHHDGDDASAIPSQAEDETFRVNLLDTAAASQRHDKRFKRNATAEEAVAAAAGVRRRSAAAVDGRTLHPRTVRTAGGWPEPAEWEVAKLSGVCSGCETDPFGTASVLSWQDTRKQFYNGALYLPAHPKCYSF